MTHLGVLCNLDTDQDPREQLSPSVINRAYLIDALLAPAGIRVFLYSPKDVSDSGEAPGYVLDRQVPVAVRGRVPRVNANWSYATRRLLRHGMGYQPFKKWLRENGIEIYVPYEFSELVSNKLRTCELVREWDASLHPRTEEFTGSASQIESFLAASRLVFIKPRAGHKGNRIFVLRRGTTGFSLEYYDSRGRRSFPSISLDGVLSVVDAATRKEHYIVQEGIQSLRHQDVVFDVRVVVVHDGEGWHSLFETRLAPHGSDLTNVYQGGTICVTDELLASTLGRERSQVVMNRLKEISFDLANRFESRFPGALSEIGFDFVIATDHEPRLIEVNAKPGIAGIGSERRLFEWEEDERSLHEMWTLPHMKSLAGFLQRRIETGSS